MGNCYSNQTLDSNQYNIFLKVPNSKKCFQVNNKSNSWVYNEDINVSLKKLYNIKLNYWIVYNDETPTKTSSSCAHAKGILSWNNEIITWLVHSVPKFPEVFDGTNNFPDINHSELIYGQSFIFIKIDIKHLDNILNQLFIMHPNVYISNYNYNYKNLNKDFNIYKISDNIQHVAKSSHYHKDLYEDILIPAFGGPCYTETWVRGHHCIDSTQCKMINKIILDNISYTFTHDHSKYCYSIDNGWVMIGDLNRMTTQYKRGGGGIIIYNDNLCKLFNSINVNN